MIQVAVGDYVEVVTWSRIGDNWECAARTGWVASLTPEQIGLTLHPPGIHPETVPDTTYPLGKHTDVVLIRRRQP